MTDKKQEGIQSTRDYNKFFSIQGNRSLNNTHLARLTLSIMTNNMLAVNPIIVNEKMQIIDGQHRFEVAKANKLKIFYIVMNSGNLTNVIELNANNRSWLGRDYIESYAIQGNKNYQWLLKFMEEYQISSNQARLFIWGSTEGMGTTGGGHAFNIIRQGKFKPSPEQIERAESRADLFYEVRPFTNQRGIMPSAMVVTLIKIHDEGLEKTLIKNLKARAISFTPERTIREAEAQIRSFI